MTAAGLFKMVFTLAFIYLDLQLLYASAFEAPNRRLEQNKYECPSKYTNMGSNRNNLCLRIPKTETTYNNAKAICEATSGSLIRVEELKHLDWKTIQNSIKFPIFRLDALKGSDGQWKTSNSKPVDFSDFPNFDQKIGDPGTSIVWILRDSGSPLLYPIPSDISSNENFIFYPICSVAAIEKGRYNPMLPQRYHRPNKNSYYQPAPYHAPATPYGHQAPTYGNPSPQYGGYGYEKPKYNCTVENITEVAEVCVPDFETVCTDVKIAIKIIVDKEFRYQSTSTICAETRDPNIIINRVCSYAYQQKTEEITAKTVKVTFEKKEDIQMVTVCQPGRYGYGPYGHNYCKEVAQTTTYNCPVLIPIDVPTEVTYPESIETCMDQRISLPIWSCEDIVENRTMTVPEAKDSWVNVEKCDTKLLPPVCQKVELTLPKQVCVELVNGYAHEPKPAYIPAHPAVEG